MKLDLENVDIESIPPELVMQYNIKHRPSIWAQYYTKLKGRDYRFERLTDSGDLDLKGKALGGQRQFLQQPLDDQHEWKSFQKSRQCGASENHVRETLWFADQHPHTKQVYVFPTDQQVSDFSRTRIDEVVKDSPYLIRRLGMDPKTRKRLPGGEEVINSVHLRKIGESFIFFRSGHSPKAGEGIDCDIVYFDEIDRMHPNVFAAFNETLTSSNYGWRRDISTPSLPGVGVNQSFSRSDQHHWWMKCPHCNHFFTLILDEDYGIVELPRDTNGRANHDYHLHYDFIQEDDTHAFACPKCHRAVSDETRIQGFWHPLHSDNKRIRGYQISQLICPWISATKIIQKKEDYQGLEQAWTNYVIGLPYLGDNVLVTSNDIWACVDRSLKNPYELKREGLNMGVDWGNESWMITGMLHPDGSGRIIIMDIASVKDREAQVTADGKKDNPHIREVANKMRQWQATRGVFDAGYGKDRNHELLNQFPARVFSCFYPEAGAKTIKTFQDQWDEKGFKVSVDRTMTLKVATKMFVDRKVVIPEWVVLNPLFETFIRHVTNLVSIKDIEEDMSTRTERIIERIGSLPGGDHLGHAWNYLTIALRAQKAGGGNSDFFM